MASETVHDGERRRWRLSTRTRLLCLEGDINEPSCILVEELLHNQELLYIVLHLSARLD